MSPGGGSARPDDADEAHHTVHERAVAAPNEAVPGKAASQKPLRTARVWPDTTMICKRDPPDA